MNTLIPVFALIAAVLLNSPPWALAIIGGIAVIALATETTTIVKRWRAL